MYHRINIDDYIRTGEGATAVAYTHKTEPRLVKLYNKGFEADEALRDFRIAKTVYDMGLPSPEPYRMVTDGERDLWIDLGLFSHGVPEWDVAQLWIFTNRLDEDRQKALFHLDRAQMLEHWNIFVRAYYGIDTEEQVGAVVKRLLPYAVIRIPFMLNMAYRRPISEGLANFVVDSIG